MKKQLLLTFTIMIIVSGCSDLFNSNNDIEIRIENTNAFAVDSVIVNPGSASFNFGTINQGESTVYQPFEYGYRNAFIELRVNGSPFRQQPIDHVGESKLKGGSYTMILQVDTTAGFFGGIHVELKKS